MTADTGDETRAGAGTAPLAALLDSERRSASPFQQAMGYRLIDWAEGRALVEYETSPSHTNRTARLHGGVIATLLDTAAGYAGVFTGDPVHRQGAVTLSLTVSFVSAVTGGRILVEGRRTGGGRKIFFAEAHARAEDGTLIASAVGTFRHVPVSEAAHDRA